MADWQDGPADRTDYSGMTPLSAARRAELAAQAAQALLDACPETFDSPEEAVAFAIRWSGENGMGVPYPRRSDKEPASGGSPLAVQGYNGHRFLVWMTARGAVRWTLQHCTKEFFLRYIR